MGLSTNTKSNSGGICNIAFGNAATDAVAAADTDIVVGFTPRYVMWMNKASMLKIEFFEGMAVGTGYRSTAGGAQTLDVAPAGITVAPGKFTVKAADIPASGAFLWMAIG
jgi:hypothetical protein